MGHEYLTEKRLRVLDPQLHSQYKNCVVVSNQMLSRYQSKFPEYTDHSTLHTLEIVDTSLHFAPIPFAIQLLPWVPTIGMWGDQRRNEPCYLVGLTRLLYHVSGRLYSPRC